MHRFSPIDSTPHRGAPRAHKRLFRLRTTFTENSRRSRTYLHVWLFSMPRISSSSRILYDSCPEAIAPRTLDSAGIPPSILGGYSELRSAKLRSVCSSPAIGQLLLTRQARIGRRLLELSSLGTTTTGLLAWMEGGGRKRFVSELRDVWASLFRWNGWLLLLLPIAMDT